IACGLAFVVIGSASAQCPSIVVVGPAGITTQGDTMTYRVETGRTEGQLSYRWTISAGTIETGQGTPAITVRTHSGMMGLNVGATVKIDGLPSGCENVASGVAPVGGIDCGLASDEWGDLRPNDQRSRLDNFFVELMNNPTHRGVIVLTVTPKDKLDSKNKRVQLAIRHADFRKFDRTRLWFALEKGDEVRTKLFSISPGMDLPCDKCQIIKGGDF
ncbi:MAG TPA: hypothetical protein VJV05_05440, partial [Pyrinomonadaceae bacterium]|nr:hypothetical protein [Pyrinomonadaceae bacterium]